MSDATEEVKPWTHFYWDIFAGTCWPFDESKVICGRSDGHFQYEDNELSKVHCEFLIEFEKCFLTDLDSKNSTYLNLKEIESNTPFELKCFDVIIFGKQIIIYFDVELFNIKDRQDLLEKISKNIDNDDIRTEIKNKSIIFMRSFYPRMKVKNKIQNLESKISSAYTQKEEKLLKFVDKAHEFERAITELKEKITKYESHIKEVNNNKEVLASKIDPQIDALHQKMDELNTIYEKISDETETKTKF